MIFNPQDLIKKEGSFVFSGDVKANAHSCLNKSIIKEFWKNLRKTVPITWNWEMWCITDWMKWLKKRDCQFLVLNTGLKQ